MEIERARALLANAQVDPALFCAAAEALILDVLAAPHPEPMPLAATLRVLRTASMPVEAYERALHVLTAIIYRTPDVLDVDAAHAVCDCLAHTADARIAGLAGTVLGHLLLTPARPVVAGLACALAGRPDLPRLSYAALLHTIQATADWAAGTLSLPELADLAERHQLSAQRPELLQVIERVMLADPAAVTPGLLERLLELHAGNPDLRYVLAHLAARPAARPEVRTLAAAAVRGRFSFRTAAQARLCAGSPRALIVQNIRDGQGDELIRVGPLIQALLDANPRLEVTLVTGRAYLYAHPRLTTVPIFDRAAIEPLFARAWTFLMDCYEPTTPAANYDTSLESACAAYLRRFRPPLILHAAKGGNHFVFQELVVDGRPVEALLGLHRTRIANVYETGYRLLAELGLPIRMGEEAAMAGPILAGMRCPEADALWDTLVASNVRGCPVALLNPFGGLAALKGYVESTLPDLAARIGALVAEGYFVVSLPNGTEWGGAAMATRAVDRLPDGVRGGVVIAPDPGGRSSEAMYHLDYDTGVRSPQRHRGTEDARRREGADRTVRTDRADRTDQADRSRDVHDAAGISRAGAGQAGVVGDGERGRVRADHSGSPDPASGDRDVGEAMVYRAPYASQVMHLFTHCIRRADLVVAVEGWAVHVAHALGKPYRVLMLPYSQPEKWHPYGCSLRQQAARPLSAPDAGSELLPEWPRKAILLLLLEALGRFDAVDPLPTLRRFIHGPDGHLGRAAARSLSRHPAADPERDLIPLLHSAVAPVRADAAQALLAIAEMIPGAMALPCPLLEAHARIGARSRDWDAIAALGPQAYLALEIAASDEDPVIRREAIAFRTALADAHPTLDTLPRRPAVLRGFRERLHWFTGWRSVRSRGMPGSPAGGAEDGAPPDTEPIDAVYLWVDGADPAFQASLEHHIAEAPTNLTAAAPQRFRDNGELRYALRSLERHVPWIRHVYLVTNGQVPAWLDTTHPRVTVVPHHAIFPDHGHLPTFNTRAIQMHVHRIPGLSRWFLYMNDDEFFGRPVDRAVFMPTPRTYRIYIERDTLPRDESMDDDHLVHIVGTLRRVAAGRNRAMPWSDLPHCPLLLNRDLLAQLVDRWAAEARRTSAHRFRQPTDLSLPIAYVAASVAEGAAPDGRRLELQPLVASSLDYAFVCFTGVAQLHADDVDMLLRWRPRFIGLNDDMEDETAVEGAAALRSLLAYLFPEPSSFEGGTFTTEDTQRVPGHREGTEREREGSGRVSSAGAALSAPAGIAVGWEGTPTHEGIANHPAAAGPVSAIRPQPEVAFLPLKAPMHSPSLPAPNGPYAEQQRDQDAAIAAALGGPGRSLSGRGIVLLAGGPRYFTCAWVCLTILRQTLGCTLPIQVWYLGRSELSARMEELLRGFDVTLVDALALAPDGFAGPRPGWQAKPFAIAHSGFREVVWIDADTVPLIDPATLFDDPGYRRAGALFWPDLTPLPPSSPIWEICRVPYRDEASFETGLLAIDVVRCWTALSLTLHMNRQAPFYYQYLHGDKDTFHLAWRMCGAPYSIVAQPPRHVTAYLTPTDHSPVSALVQHDRLGRPILLHRTRAKWNAWGLNAGFSDFPQHHETCLEALRALRERWDGRIAPRQPATASGGSASDLIRMRRFRYHIVGAEERVLELLPGGAIGDGRKKHETSWHLTCYPGEWQAEAHTLIIGGAEGETCRLNREEDGVWRGRWRIYDRSPVELIPLEAE